MNRRKSIGAACRIQSIPATADGETWFQRTATCARCRTIRRPPSSTGIWVVLFAITMTFAAFTSALIVRKGASLDWRHFTLPSILYFNTVLLLASSVTLEVSRRRVAVFMGGLKRQTESPARWLYVTLSLGLLFVAGQYRSVAPTEWRRCFSGHKSQ